MKIKAVCRKDVINKNGTSPLALRFTHERKVKYVGLGISINLDHWNESEELITDECPNRKEYQYIIDTKLAEYHRKIQRLEILEIEVNFETLLDTNSRKIPNQTIEEYFGKLIDCFEKSGKINSATKYYFCLSALKKFRPMNITFDKVDNAFLREFEQFLRKQGNSGNTIASRFTSLKSTYNKALEDGIFRPKENVFVKFKVGRLWEKTRKRAITKEDVMRLKDMTLPKDSRFGYMEFSRDVFLFSYYTAGINFKILPHSDTAILRTVAFPIRDTRLAK